MENRWKADPRVPTGFGVAGAEAKNGYAGIRGFVYQLTHPRIFPDKTRLVACSSIG